MPLCTWLLPHLGSCNRGSRFFLAACRSLVPTHDDALCDDPGLAQSRDVLRRQPQEAAKDGLVGFAQPPYGTLDLTRGRM